MMLCLAMTVTAQKRSDRTDKKGAASVAPKRTTRSIPESERVRIITKTEFVKVDVRPDKGYFSIVAVPGAAITLTPVNGENSTEAIKRTITDADGSLNLINLLPGRYRLQIEHADYNPLSETITIKPAAPDTFVALSRMVMTHGAINIGGAPANAVVRLDGRPVPSLSAEPGSGNLLIGKVPVGRHRLKISKQGFVDYDQEVDVLPGPQQTFVSARLDEARVALNVISESGARVYVDDEEKAVVPGSGNVSIRLVPGRHRIKVIKDGYQEWPTELNLSLNDASPTVRAALVPIPSSAEGDWQPVIGQRKWFPQPPGWKFAPAGAMVRGDSLVLYDTESNRDFNTYRDFHLEFDVVFSNRKGAAWAVRAKDLQNYYLFEFATPAGRTPVINFYISRNGVLELKDSRPVVEKIDKPGDSFHVVCEARGNTFDIRLSIASAPSTQPHRIAIFQDDELTWGGLGFRGRDLSEFLLQSFFVIPIK